MDELLQFLINVMFTEEFTEDIECEVIETTLLTNNEIVDRIAEHQ